MTTARLGRRAVVIGAGVAGLAASLALAPCFEQVIVLERSGLPDAPTPREGVPQGRHPHVLLGGGQRALELLSAGFERELGSAGAVPYRVGLDTRYERPGFDPFPRRDLGWSGLAVSRPLLELVLRRRVRGAQVQLWPDCPVERVLASHGGGRVVGVRLAGPGARRIAADLVIDASGSGKPTLQALAESGLPAPAETRIEVDMGYTSALFAVPSEAPDWKVLLLLSDAPKTSRSAVLTPLEGGRWFVLVSGRHAEKPPGDWDGFFGFVRQLRTPTLATALQPARGLGAPVRFGFRASVWRHFERSSLPIGLLPIGDAICRFNPIYGQGMSVAAQEAQLLRSSLDGCAAEAEPLLALRRDFLSHLGALIEAPWALAATPDFVYPETRGERPPFFADGQRFNAALMQLAAEDASVHRAVLEVQHLLRPLSDLRTPELRERVLASMAAARASA
jgi:2-polyprenyl-6-methoxyphenol hydroxylase-like FAD-dependent oxidoreductase